VSKTPTAGRERLDASDFADHRLANAGSGADVLLQVSLSGEKGLSLAECSTILG
jgi:hypothetical protein